MKLLQLSFGFWHFAQKVSTWMEASKQKMSTLVSFYWSAWWCAKKLCLCCKKSKVWLDKWPWGEKQSTAVLETFFARWTQSQRFCILHFVGNYTLQSTYIYLKEKSRKNIASPRDFNCILGYFCVKKSNKNVKKKSYTVVIYWQNNRG